MESVRDSNENSFIYGETPQKATHQGARSLFKRKAGIGREIKLSPSRRFVSVRSKARQFVFVYAGG